MFKANGGTTTCQWCGKKVRTTNATKNRKGPLWEMDKDEDHFLHCAQFKKPDIICTK